MYVTSLKKLKIFMDVILKENTICEEGKKSINKKAA